MSRRRRDGTVIELASVFVLLALLAWVQGWTPSPALMELATNAGLIALVLLLALLVALGVYRLARNNGQRGARPGSAPDEASPPRESRESSAALAQPALERSAPSSREGGQGARSR